MSEEKNIGQLNSKKVLICGAYGLGNSGDEAILKAIIERLRLFDPDIEITVISRSPATTAKHFNIKTVGSFDLRSLFIAMRKCDLLLFGGGSLIQDVTSTRSLLYYLWVIKNAKKRGCKVLVYGCGIGPVHLKKNQKRTSRIFNKYVDEITVRDEDSFDTLKQFGVTKPPIHQGSDLALSLEKSDEDTIDNVLKQFNVDPSGCYACFCIRDWHGIEPKIDEIRLAAGRCYYEHGLTPLFLLLNPQKDMEITLKIINGLSVPYAIIDQELSTSLLIGVISRMKVMISVRLHALVFAAGQGVPFVAINYDPKIKSFASYVKNENCIEISDINAATLMNGISNVTTLSSKMNLLDNSQRIIINEEKNLEILSKFLEAKPQSNIKPLTRIAFFETDFQVGGIQKSLITILSKLDYTRCSVDVYYYNDNFFFEKPNNPNLHFIKLKPASYCSRFIPFRLYKWLKEPFISAKSYDVAIDFNSYQNECALGTLCTPAKKHVMWIHNDMAIKKRNEWKYDLLWIFFCGKFKFYDEFVAVSPRIINSFKYAAHLPNAKVSAIPNYVDGNEIIEKSKENPDYYVDENQYNICSVGRLCHQKGFDILLDKFAKAYKQRSDLRLYIIGTGPDEKKLKAQCEKLGIIDVVTFTGNLSNPFALEKYMDGFALCSRYEGQGMVIKEAQALGLELFLARNLDGYNEGVVVCPDLVSAMVEAQKKPRLMSDLKEYNDDITNKLEHLIFD